MPGKSTSHRPARLQGIPSIKGKVKPPLPFFGGFLVFQRGRQGDSCSPRGIFWKTGRKSGANCTNVLLY